MLLTIDLTYNLGLIFALWFLNVDDFLHYNSILERQ